MYQRIKKLTRPNLDTPWPDAREVLTAEQMEYFNTKYVLTGKQIFRNFEDDESGLVRTQTVLWESKEVWEEFEADPMGLGIRNMHNQHISNLGIVSSDFSEGEI
jgi:hypothetical protein